MLYREEGATVERKSGILCATCPRPRERRNALPSLVGKQTADGRDSGSPEVQVQVKHERCRRLSGEVEKLVTCRGNGASARTDNQSLTLALGHRRSRSIHGQDRSITRVSS